MMKVMRAIVTPVDAVYTGLDAASQEQSFDEWLQAGIHAASPLKRFYPMPVFVGLDDNSSDNVTNTSPYGDETVLSEGKINITQQYDPDYCLTNRLHAFNDNSPRRVIFVDINSEAWGTKITGDFKGYKMRIFATSKRPNTADAITYPSIIYNSLSSEEWANKDYRTLELDYDSITGLENITMATTTSGSNTVIFFVDECSNEDVTSELQALAGQANAWLKNGAPFGTAPSYSEGKFTVATTVVTGSTITLADPSVLYGLGVVGKECENTVVIA
ncbi:MAG: hypothetical protein LBL18_03410 [Bacteroidales bacterium]|nr:hypothetical protein [Bacteroidales bacterium]